VGIIKELMEIWPNEVCDRIVGPNVSNHCGNMRFFNTSICDDGCAVIGGLRRKESIVKVLKMRK